MKEIYLTGFTKLSNIAQDIIAPELSKGLCGLSKLNIINNNFIN